MSFNRLTFWLTYALRRIGLRRLPLLVIDRKVWKVSTVTRTCHGPYCISYCPECTQRKLGETILVSCSKKEEVNK